MQNGNEIYGAIISGEHKFYITEKGKPEFQSGVANFTQLWQIKNGAWKMTRILSFNHHEPDYINTRKEIEVPGKQLDQLAGSYKSKQSGTMTVIRDNKVLLLKGGNNTFILELDGTSISIITYNALSYLMTKDERFAAKLLQGFNTLVGRSTLISGTGEKERNRFFRTQREKIEQLLK